MSGGVPSLLQGGSGFDLPALPGLDMFSGNLRLNDSNRVRGNDNIVIDGDVTINIGGQQPTSRTDAASGTGDDVDDGDIDLAGKLLEMAGNADSPEDKANLIKAAIELLGGEATQDAPASETPPTDDDCGCGDDNGGSAEPTTFSGDDLRPWLSAEGGTVEEGKDNGFSVENGPNGTDRVSGEIDRGQSLTFTVPPENAENAGGEVTLGKLFRNGPDGDHVEQAKVTFRDENGKVVDEQIVQGTPDGEVTVSTDKPFASVEVQPLDNGAGGSSDNSDFVLKSVSVNPADGGDATSGTDDASSTDAAGAADDASGDQSQTEILNLLGQLVNLIETNVQDPEQKSKLLDIVGQLMQSLLGSGAIQPTSAAAN
jgi:hypothetical protein